MLPFPPSKLDKLILKMLEDGNIFCDHIGHVITQGKSAICCFCMKREDGETNLVARASLLDKAQQNIARYEELKEWRDHNNSTAQGVDVAQYPTYEEGYKRGVEDATEPFGYGVLGTTNNDTTRLNDRLSQRRKQLLTKKVTKWVGVYAGDEIPLWFGRTVCDSKEQADKYYRLIENYLGAYPVEIEIPL
jgi:hypothetical protein